MTQQPPTPAAKAGEIQIPPITMPLCTRVWCASPWTDPKAKLTAGEPVLWAIDQPHPFVAAFKIVRMYVIPGSSVDVFSSDGGTTGLRHTLPWHLISLIEEAMDAKVFVEEMIAAETDDEDDEPDDPDDLDDPDDEPKELLAGTDHDPKGLVPLPITSNGGQS